jgi:hypothetical protein
VGFDFFCGIDENDFFMGRRGRDRGCKVVPLFLVESGDCLPVESPDCLRLFLADAGVG